MAVLVATTAGPAAGADAGVPVPTWFEDVTSAAGIQAPRASWGAAWGDVDGDGGPDLWMNRHGRQRPRLYLNRGDGTFQDVGRTGQPLGPRLDPHGAVFLDLDRDGDDDLVQSVDNSGLQKVLVNDGGIFGEAAVELGLDFPDGRVRSPLVLDVDGDGWLDVLLPTIMRAEGEPPPALFRGGPEGFVDATAWAEVGVLPIQYGQVADLDGDGTDELLLNRSVGTSDGTDFAPVFPHGIVRTGRDPVAVDPADVGLPVTDPARDSVVADLTGDGLVDVLVVGGAPRNGLQLRAYDSSAMDDPFSTPDDGFLQARMNPIEGELGFTFTAGPDAAGDRDVRFLIAPKFQLPADDIVVGGAGTRGLSVEQPNYHVLELDPADPVTWGRPPGAEDGLMVWFDPAEERWTVVHRRAGRADSTVVAMPRGPVTSHEAIGFDATLPGYPNRLLVNAGAGFEDRTPDALRDALGAVNVAAGDFDNDGDLDLYLVMTRSVGNRPNVLLENLGGGDWAEVPMAGGARGPEAGHGGSVTTADVDLDGGLDVLVTNGRKPSYGEINDGPTLLYRATPPPDRHWVAIDLVGTDSNVHGFGAKVTVTAGERAQVRWARAGVHERGGQHHRRLHVGLGDATAADVRVEWPSGHVTELTDVAVDQALVVHEVPPPPPPAPPPRRPTVVITSPGQGDVVAAPIVLAGSADDDRGVAQVRVALKDTVTDRWWRGADTWGGWLLHAAVLGSPREPVTDWHLAFPDAVAGRRYNVLVTGWDVDGELVERRAWSWFRADD